MPKIRKKPMTNREVLIKLFKAGYKTYVGKKASDDCFSEEWQEQTTWNWKTRVRSNWWNRNYMIPLSVFKQHVNKRFKPQFNIGDMIRINAKSKRKRVRNQYRQVVGDSQNFQHLGIGSGKEYMSEKVNDAVNEQVGTGTRYGYYNRGHNIETGILIGNNRYCPNVLDSVNRAKAYLHMGYQRERENWSISKNIQPRELFEYIPILGDGVFGPKQLVNGYVTEIYVHFLYPKWVTKREARYKLTFDSGASGIWTNDYITRVYDTDYEVDEKMMAGCPYAMQCKVVKHCDHHEVHEFNGECNISCDPLSRTCEPLYDYTNFFDTTHGIAKDLEDENE